MILLFLKKETIHLFFKIFIFVRNDWATDVAIQLEYLISMPKCSKALVIVDYKSSLAQLCKESVKMLHHQWSLFRDLKSCSLPIKTCKLL